MEWEALFLDLSNFLVSIGEREAGATTSAAESILVRISSFQRVLYAIETTLRDHDDGDRELQGVLPTVSSLLSDLEQINTRWMFIGCEISRYIRYSLAMQLNHITWTTIIYYNTISDQGLIY